MFDAVLTPALAIVVLTMAVRLLISPLSYLQARAAKRSAALAPELAALREKHRDNPMTLATESLALQRANGISPWAALLPALAQAPFFMLMYHQVQSVSGTLFGVPLTAHLLAGLPIFLVLLALAGFLAWWSSKRMPQGLLRWMPYLSIAAIAWLPLAVGLYLVTSTAWTALEQLILRR
ncbi:membrane protein insertase YidC [Winogradskya humida]|uniref:Membrane protein insertase YidC n=1 Tax=Winogradskya humida TaxID=113566 RepID=A0ABQ3ZW45_9ACTN|nr:membrane protein insertase YidC [Actinoplanes humidus]GIE22773.1 protein translocase component YidC [Actinoplanes humidus]